MELSDKDDVPSSDEEQAGRDPNTASGSAFNVAATTGAAVERTPSEPGSLAFARPPRPPPPPKKKKRLARPASFPGAIG